MTKNLTHEDQVAIVKNTYDACLWFAPYLSHYAIYFEERHRAHFEEVHARFMVRIEAASKKDSCWTSSTLMRELARAKWVQKHPFLVRSVLCFANEYHVKDLLLEAVAHGNSRNLDFSHLPIVGGFHYFDAGDYRQLMPQDYESMLVTKQVETLQAVLSSNDTSQKVATKKLKI